MDVTDPKFSFKFCPGKAKATYDLLFTNCSDMPRCPTRLPFKWAFEALEANCKMLSTGSAMNHSEKGWASSCPQETYTQKIMCLCGQYFQVLLGSAANSFRFDLGGMDPWRKTQEHEIICFEEK